MVLFKEREMQRLKHLLAAAAVVGAGIIASTNFAEARDYVVTAADCVPPPPPPLQWYNNYLRADFVPDWGPFFRHHVYRYGPVLVCSAIALPPVISSKY
jgi:hypothetical protein